MVAGVQVDLLARDPKNVLTIVEVKLKSALTHLSYGQRRRLFRAGQVLAGFEPVQLVLVQVSEQASAQELILIPVDALTD